MGAVEELGVIEGTTLGILEGPRAGVGNTASAGSVSVSTTGEGSTGAAFFFSASSFKYSASICWMSVQGVGITFTSFFSSQGT